VGVVGAHRSGTSLTTRVLIELGLAGGRPEHMLPADERDNPAGYWEHSDVIAINDAILAALGGESQRPPAPTDGWQRDPALRPLCERARELYEQRFAGGARWVWKDPRLSLTLPLWREVMPAQAFVVCVRNPLEVSASLHARHPGVFTTRELVGTWLEYTVSALDATADRPRLVVLYDDYFDAPDWQLDRLAAFLGGVPAESLVAARRLVEASLRRNRATAHDLVRSDEVPSEATLLYLLLREAHRPPGTQPTPLHDGFARELRARRRERALRDDGRSAELAELREELLRHRGWLESVTGSLSWRLTSPLRFAAARARRLGRR
jgi:hypothetical protein